MKTCQHCKKQFETNKHNPKQKYCSRKCRINAFQKKDKVYKEAFNPFIYEDCDTVGGMALLNLINNFKYK